MATSIYKGLLKSTQIDTSKSILKIEESEIYSDFDTLLRSSPGKKDINKVKNEKAINQSLTALFSTVKGERFWNLSYGTRIPKLLFEPFDQTTAQMILDEIKLGISKYEYKRIKPLEIGITMDYDNSIYEILIKYEILNSKKESQHNFILKKT